MADNLFETQMVRDTPDIAEDNCDGEESTGDRLFGDVMDSFGPPTQPPTTDKPAEKPAGKLAEATSPTPYEIVDEKDKADAAAKRQQEIKDVAVALKGGTFDDKSKQLLLKALNTGATEPERRRSFNDLVNSVNRELAELNKGERNPAKQFQIRSQDVRNDRGERDQLKIGLQNRRSATYNDSFTVRLKK